MTAYWIKVRTDNVHEDNNVRIPAFKERGDDVTHNARPLRTATEVRERKRKQAREGAAQQGAATTWDKRDPDFSRKDRNQVRGVTEDRPVWTPQPRPWQCTVGSSHKCCITQVTDGFLRFECHGLTTGVRDSYKPGGEDEGVNTGQGGKRQEAPP